MVKLLIEVLLSEGRGVGVEVVHLLHVLVWVFAVLP